MTDSFEPGPDGTAAGFSPPRRIQAVLVLFAFLLPFVSWLEAAGGILLGLLFVVLLLPVLTEKLPARGHWHGLIFYLGSLLFLVVIFRQSLYAVAAAWAVAGLGNALAGTVGRRWWRFTLPHNRNKTWLGFGGFWLAASFGACFVLAWNLPRASPTKLGIACAATALVGAIVESLPVRLSSDLTVPLVCGAFFFCIWMMESSALNSNLPYLGSRVILAILVNLALAVLAWRMGLADQAGATTGCVLGIAVYMGYGYKSFLLLFTFFLLGSVATRLGYAQKAARGIAEGRWGARGWREALANLLAGAFFAVLAITTPFEGAFLVALIATFAEAAGDTASSEIGQWLSGRAYLITTWKPVAAGANGAVSLGGSLAGLFATVAIVAVAYGLGLCGTRGALIAAVSGVAGNLLDSLLGATLENRELITNGVVNFAGTGFAGGLALGLALHLDL